MKLAIRMRKLVPGRAEAMLLIASLLFMLAVGEVTLRFIHTSGQFRAFATKLSTYVARDPDDANRLILQATLRGREDDAVFPEFHPILGWTPEPMTESNPLGILAAGEYSLDELRNRKTVLFFGDSFTNGYTDFHDMIPALLNAEFEGVSVLNFGQGGYGLDQMFLYMQSVIDLFDDTHVVIGLYFDDIDRCLNTVGRSPKPYFRSTEAGLRLEGVPIAASYRQWLDRYPPRPRSYALAVWPGLVRRVVKSRWGVQYLFALQPAESQERRAEKQTIARAIIREIKNETDRRDVPLTFVLIPLVADMIHDSWYDAFLTRVLVEEGIDFVSVKQPLRHYMAANDLEWWRDVYPLSGHPNAATNKVMADHIAAFMRGRYPHLRGQD